MMPHEELSCWLTLSQFPIPTELFGVIYVSTCTVVLYQIIFHELISHLFYCRHTLFRLTFHFSSYKLLCLLKVTAKLFIHCNDKVIFTKLVFSNCQSNHDYLFSGNGFINFFYLLNSFLLRLNYQMSELH